MSPLEHTMGSQNRQAGPLSLQVGGSFERHPDPYDAATSQPETATIRRGRAS